MAEPELPPWLTQQRPNALGSIAQGVQTGAAFAGVINQRDLTQSRLRLEEQDQQINHLKIEKAIRDRDNVLEADFIMQEVPDRIAPLLAAGKPNDARNVLLSLAARKPAVLYSETYPKLLQEVDAAVATEDKRLQLQSNENIRRELEAGRMERQKTLDEERKAQTAKLNAETLEKEAEAWLGGPSKSYAPSDAKKKVDELESMGRTLSKSEKDMLYGLAPKDGVIHKTTKTEYIERNINGKIRAERDDAPKTREQHIKELGQEYERLFSVPATFVEPPIGDNEKFMRGTDAKVPDAPRDPKERKSGEIYVTPKGILKWTGTGWIPL